MAHAQTANSTAKQFRPSSSSMGADPVLFNDLWTGDRFKIVGDDSGVIYTKVRHDAARRHSKESIALGEQGYGHLDDSVVAVKQSAICWFIPVEL